MSKSKMTYILIHREPQGHRFYREIESGRVAIADDSIRFENRPDTTDDGLLYVDTSRTLEEDARGGWHIPLVRPNGERSGTIAYKKEADYCRRAFFTVQTEPVSTALPWTKVQTIAARHVAQLALEHFWGWDYPTKHFGFDFALVKVLGRMAKSGDILCEDPVLGLRLISGVAFMDWATAKAGAVLENGEWAPTPHTAYCNKAREQYNALPQLFID